MIPEHLLPLALVGLAALALPARRRLGGAVEALMVAGLAVLFVRYFHWRVMETVLPARALDLQSAAIWAIFVIECLAWIDAAILLAQLLRRADRRAAADAHMARLRATPEAELPTVDVFIATYNEPIDVLERTILGARAIDWPAEKLRVYVLDDGRRDWLRDYAAQKGVRYLTRPDNAHAKAGNINAALARTDGDFVLVLDADFIPQPQILYRMAGFFEDEKIGVVQAPHRFFNHDPMQTNLAMRDTLPNDQRLFFNEIMPGRDGWDCAFCCGSNSLTRRTAFEAIGGRMPTGSITEDMLLTLALLRKGYVTRYLNERLAIGLAPESLDAFFVQRARWAQGGLQMLYLKEGPFGPGLSLIQRLMFLPMHWLVQALTQMISLSGPAVFLLTGLTPMAPTSSEAILSHQIPMILAMMLALRRMAPDAYQPLAATTLAALQSFRFLPVLIATLIKPTGHSFKVTPKGGDAAGRDYDPFTVWLGLTLIVGTGAGLATQIVTQTNIGVFFDNFAVVMIWTIWNGLVLGLAMTTAFSRPSPRGEERFLADEAVCVLGEDGAEHAARLKDVSMGGAQLEGPVRPGRGDWLLLDLPRVGLVSAKTQRSQGEAFSVRLVFDDEETRDRMIAFVYLGREAIRERQEEGLAGPAMFRMLLAIVAPSPPAPPPSAAPDAAEAPPAWLAALRARRLDDRRRWAEDLAVEAAAPVDRDAGAA